MTPLRKAIREQLLRFDDDAFAALANRGLLRRAYKDIETLDIEIVAESVSELIVGIGGQQVRFGVRGPSQASCDCRAAGACQHILSAAIGLQRLWANASPEAGDAPEIGTGAVDRIVAKEYGANLLPATNAIESVHLDLMRISYSDLLKHAGKSGYRWAWQFAQDLDLEKDLRIDGERNLVIGFAAPRMTFRYMGGPIEAVLPEVQTSKVEKYRVAAVMAYQRVHGTNAPAPEPVGKPRAGELDLGKDHASAATNAEILHESRVRLRASVAQLLVECVELGLSHLSQAIHERYATLAVWAQGAEYPRLALLLRRLADHVELLLERAGSADEHVLLDELTLAFGLVEALGDASARNVSPVHLVGRARTRYDSMGSLELYGVGASAWRSASGYVGLTMLFWSPSDQAFLSCSDARPELQRGFNPVARYKAAGPWSGLGAPAQAVGRRLLLTDAQVNASGRLSAAESVSAVVQEVDAEEFIARLQPCTDWSALRQERQARRRGLLAEAQPMKDWVAIRPARVGRSSFDPVRQMLAWPVFDVSGESLSLELPYSDYNSHAIARIEELSGEAWVEGALLVVRLRDASTGLIAEPLSRVGGKQGPSRNAVDALHFDPPIAKDVISKWLGKLGSRSTAPTTAGSAVTSAPSLPKALREFRHWLQRNAERGVSQDASLQADRELKVHGSALGSIGLKAILDSTMLEWTAAELVKSNYKCMQYERLIGGAADDAD